MSKEIYGLLSAEATAASGITALTALKKDAFASIVTEIVDVAIAAGEDKAVPPRVASTTVIKTVLAALATDFKKTEVGQFITVAALAKFIAAALLRLGDKKKEVSSVATEAVAALNALRLHLGAHYVGPVVIPALFVALHDQAWQARLAALTFLEELAKDAHTADIVAESMAEIITIVADLMNHVKAAVQDAAKSCMTAVSGTVGNRDIEPFLPSVVLAIADLNMVPDCVHRLASTTFVQEVEAPALAVLVPTLVRGLRDPNTGIKRKSAVIIDNMSKLVEKASAAGPFLPQLLPEVRKNADEIADPEARTTTGKALAQLETIEKELAEERLRFKCPSLEEVNGVLAAAFAGVKASGIAVDAVQAFLAPIIVNLVAARNLDDAEWVKTLVGPHLALVVADAAALTKVIVDKCAELATGDAHKRFVGADIEDEGVDLCKCTFSLAYGAKILLSQAVLHLKKGKRYALCGPNGAGKSTLMRAIVNNQVENFPPPTEVRTVYVEHDIQGDEVTCSVVEYVANNERVKEVGVTYDQCRTMLSSVGFTDAMMDGPITALSGGWKMKTALARAMLLDPHILLLDEPTNHLDVANVAWLENYLISLKDVTSIIVSHDSGFIDRVCTNVIHYEGRKLRTYIGNLSALIKIKPEAKSYYTLETSAFSFKFPEPGILDGVKSKDRAILKMRDVSFTYPGTSRLIVDSASLFVALASRIAVIGPNGAGKSTLIKMLTGELVPDSGTVWKHPNLRIAYVAQHAFHHIEQHLEKTPKEYLEWRFSIGEDREALEKVDRKVDEEEEKKMRNTVHVIDGVKLKVDKLMGRRKARGAYEYEVAWQGLIPTPDNNTWMARDELEAMGLVKLCNELDAKEAAAAGLFLRPLTSQNIAKHLADVGLEEEFTLHSHMRGLSGGQKVKVVIGAAMWLNPHILVLDEPTNYLDRDSLGALAGAIREFGGGVVMISHHSEFTDHLAKEQWHLHAGVLTVKGEVPIAGKGEKIEAKKDGDTFIDAHGNEVKIVAPKKKLSRREEKDKARMAKLAKKNGEAVAEDDYFD